MRAARGWTVVAMLSVGLAPVASARERPKPTPREATWLGDELPLPLAVKTPEDLAFKAVVEREYLVFNLLAGGKLAWDQGRWADAADKWESLLGVPRLDPAIDRVVRPLAIQARQKAGQKSTLPPAPPMAEQSPPVPKAPSVKPKAPRFVDVTGTITGGGDRGPGGAVIVLRRAIGRTPRPNPAGDWVVLQRGKQFVPHVIAVPVGATVSFKNEDRIYHDVFSLSRPNDFDLGLYMSGLARTKTFPHPGAAQLFCDIHAAMNAWIYVCDSPWYAVADAAGRFTVRHVPLGDYKVEVWDEHSTKTTNGTARVIAGMSALAFTVGGDRRPPAFPPDKYGHQRQVQLGF